MAVDFKCFLVFYSCWMIVIYTSLLIMQYWIKREYDEKLEDVWRYFKVLATLNLSFTAALVLNFYVVF